MKKIVTFTSPTKGWLKLIGSLTDGSATIRMLPFTEFEMTPDQVRELAEALEDITLAASLANMHSPDIRMAELTDAELVAELKRRGRIGR